MPLLWTPRTMPELAAFSELPAHEREAIARRTWPRIRRHWQLWVGWFLSGMSMVPLFLGIYVLLVLLRVPDFFSRVIAGTAAGFLGGTLLAQVYNRVRMPYLREEMPWLAAEARRRTQAAETPAEPEPPRKPAVTELAPKKKSSLASEMTLVDDPSTENTSQDPD